ncbi:aldo/keto reductase [Pseudogemmobacter sp. W21_MBD1_M6]|uniref:aldo/keto reductase n=1 Tax=Pseudogemmobacter sp. W21_MBD1_M6 TaxID=3240271 RepID=UPI003F9B58AD
MRMNTLGRTGLRVSELCLGSMTWGTQNTEAEAHAQLDMALDHGINFIDTAEMYPVNPVSAETVGRTEQIIGTWIAKNGRRDAFVLASKISGAGSKSRGGAPITGAALVGAVDQALARLQTDVIDLYQLHWPNRGSYMFRQNWAFDPSGQNREDTLANMEEVLRAAQGLVDAGKIRHFGLSNESAWGTAQWLRLSDEHGLPRMQTIQNEYSLLCRMYDTDLAEVSVNEEVGLLAYSPLGTGLLTGKYQGGAVPEGSRMDINGTLGGRKSERVFPAVDAYLAIARKHGLDPVHMALAWCRTRPFMASAIFGATDVDQLARVFGSVDVVLGQEVLDEINIAHKAHPMPY